MRPYINFCFQFLKKVQRQERAVEEIKMVLKPHYNRKKIDKEGYKEILRKCVPKVNYCNKKTRNLPCQDNCFACIKVLFT